MTKGAKSLRTTPATDATANKLPTDATVSTGTLEPQSSAPAQKINTTGKPIAMVVPLKEGRTTLVDIPIVIEPDDSLSITKALIVEKIGPQLDSAAKAKLASLKEMSGMVRLDDLKAAGLAMRFDPGLLELVFELSADQRPVGELSVATFNPQHSGVGAAIEKPSLVAGFLNLYAGVDHRWGTSQIDEKTSVRVDAEAVLRVGNAVFENEFGFDGAVDQFRCPAGTSCNFVHREGFKRRASRMIYDAPEWNVRFHAGDTTTLSTSMQSTPDVLGLRIDHSPRVFSPRMNLAPSGRSSFRIERPSDVEILVNSVVVQRFQLKPGQYNIRDLPLQAGANDIELVITDDTGIARRLTFTSFSATQLLAEGKSEWSVSGGLPSYMRDNEREYRKDDWIGTLFGRYGMTDKLTAELSFQADNRVQLAGAALYSALPIGFFGMQGSVSNSETGVGYAAIATYDLSNIRGLASIWTGQREAIRLSAEYRSDAYRTPGEFLATATGILAPQYNYAWRFAGAYTMPLSNGISATLSGRYQIGNDEAFRVSPLTVTRDRYGVDLALSASMTDWLSGSLTVGYGNDSLLRDVTAPSSDIPEFRAGVRFAIRPSDGTRINARYDSLYNDANVSTSAVSQKGQERWDASADLHRYGDSENSVATATLGYTGNRGEARVIHSAGTRTLDIDPSQIDSRSSLRVGTAIAFAGGKVGIGAPIRSGGFAIVHTHESIAGKPVTVGSKEEPKAVSSKLGPAVVTGLPNYAHSNLSVDVDDLPVGYSLGKGSFDVAAPYRAGYALEVGSANSISAYGELLHANGDPVALITGTARTVSGKGAPVMIFTNGAGRFGAEGLAPGRWVIEMATEGAPTRFEIEIPKGTAGLFKAGTLKPVNPAAARGT